MQTGCIGNSLRNETDILTLNHNRERCALIVGFLWHYTCPYLLVIQIRETNLPSQSYAAEVSTGTLHLDSDPLAALTDQSREVPRVAICDSYPVMIEGFRTIVARNPDFELGPSAASLLEAMQILHDSQPEILLLDGAFGMKGILGLLSSCPRTTGTRTNVIVFSLSFSVRERDCFLRAGVKGLLRKDASPEEIAGCLRTVGAGSTWIEMPESSLDETRYGLTDREFQVLGLAMRGLTNKAIGTELGIALGTIKLHMKHIFDKTGVRGRNAVVLKHLAEHGRQTPHAAFREASQTIE